MIKILIKTEFYLITIKYFKYAKLICSFQRLNLQNIVKLLK